MLGNLATFKLSQAFYEIQKNLLNQKWWTAGIKFGNYCRIKFIWNIKSSKNHKMLKYSFLSNLFSAIILQSEN